MIIGLTNQGQPRRPDAWGFLRAWGFSASRGRDYLETDPAVHDANGFGIEGGFSLRQSGPGRHGVRTAYSR